MVKQLVLGSRRGPAVVRWVILGVPLAAVYPLPWETLALVRQILRIVRDCVLRRAFRFGTLLDANCQILCLTTV